MPAGGVPLNLCRRRRIVARPEIVLLCDVSESVSAFSTFMLQLVYTIQNRFNFVRSFLFVDLIDEVTAHFKESDVDQAICNALGRGLYSHGITSDYGRVFDLFVRNYLPTVPPRTTLIVLGDARNNRYPEYGRAFAQIREHVRRIIWINPQPQEEWNTHDSIMSRYEPLCDQVFECRNLRQLEEVMDLIM